MNGIEKYVTETTETILTENVEHRVTGKLVAKANFSILVRERKWMDIDPERFCQDSHIVKSHDKIAAT